MKASRNTKAVRQTLFQQDDSQGPNYNGDISGDVSTVNTSGGNTFSSSHNDPKIGGVFNVANVNDMVIVHLSPPRRRTNRVLEQLIESVRSFFQSSANREALRHPLAGVEAPTTTAASMPVQCPTNNLLAAPNSEDDNEDGENNEDARPLDGPERLQHDPGYNVSSMDELDLRSLQSQVTTNAEIYTRGPRGIVPGDVGTFDLTYGFKKIFNLWEGEFATDYDLPTRKIVHPEGFAEGHTITSGTSSKIHRSEDERYIQLFEFECDADQGAVLACTTSADVEELDDPFALRNFLIEHAGVVYQRATSLARRQLTDEESLYIVSGCIKSDSWGIAAYQRATSGQKLMLKSRLYAEGGNKKGVMYEWADRGQAEARFGINSRTQAGQYEGKNQCLFLRGFKLAFSSPFRAQMLSLKQVGTGTGSSDGDQGENEPKSSDRSGPSSSGRRSGSSTGSQPKSSSNFSSMSGYNTLSSVLKVESFPEISGRTTFHPCDLITELLLEMTGADCALSHDDDWRDIPRSSSWNDALSLEIIDSKTIGVLRGVAHLRSTQSDKKGRMWRGDIDTQDYWGTHAIKDRLDLRQGDSDISRAGFIGIKIELLSPPFQLKVDEILREIQLGKDPSDSLAKLGKGELQTEVDKHDVKCELAPRYGQLHTLSHEMVDNFTIVALWVSIKQLTQATREGQELTFERVDSILQANPFLEHDLSCDIDKTDVLSDEYRRDKIRNKCFGMEPKLRRKETDRLVRGWFERLIWTRGLPTRGINDHVETIQDIFARTSPDMDSDHESAEGWEKEILDFSISRFPDVEQTYIEVYHIRLSIAASSRVKAFSKTLYSSVQGEFRLRRFRLKGSFEVAMKKAVFPLASQEVEEVLRKVLASDQ